MRGRKIYPGLEASKMVFFKKALYYNKTNKTIFFETHLLKSFSLPQLVKLRKQLDEVINEKSINYILDGGKKS